MAARGRRGAAERCGRGGAARRHGGAVLARRLGLVVALGVEGEGSRVRRGQLKAGTRVWACVPEMEGRDLRRDGRGSLRRGGEEASKRGPRFSGRSALGAAERGERAGLACGRRGCGTRRAGPRAWAVRSWVKRELARAVLAGRAGWRVGPRKGAWAAFGWADREGRAARPGC